MILLILFAFLAGIVTVLSPCILPLLPIILSSSDTNGKQKPLGVVVGFVASFTFFTLFLSSIVRFSGISADSLRLISVVILALFGLSLLIPKIQLQIEIWFSRLAAVTPLGQNRQGWLGGLLIGFSLGLLWTPCVGPILASVISLALTGSVTAESFVITFAYSIGTAIPMFIIMLAGSTALQKVPWLLKSTAEIQKGFGVLMMITAVAIYFNVDRSFQTYILTVFPNYGVGLTQFEDKQVIRDQLNTIQPESQTEKNTGLFLSTFQPKVPAPELVQGGEWFNSAPLHLDELKGKVVLIDFWTYSCINCQRTLPYLRIWWEKYRESGLVIIGVHSPEFEFEKDPNNVQQAIKDFALTYPVMQDNDFATWKGYSNRYWPAKYLIDKDGNIRYTHFGEGKYDETEEMIQRLLQESGSDVSSVPVENPEYQIYSRTPELYLGYARIEYLASPERIVPDQIISYSAPSQLPQNFFAYQGDWSVMSEYSAPSAQSKLFLNFESQKVYLVARPKEEVPGKMKVILDNEFIKELTVDTDTLYTLIELPEAGRHLLELEFLDKNIEVYAFTFG